MQNFIKNQLLFWASYLFVISATVAQTLYPIDWTDKANVTVNGNNSLTRTGSGGWNAGAASTNLLFPGENGQIEFTLSSTSGAYMIGLSRSNYNTSYQTIEYALYINNGSIYIYESSNNVAGYGSATVGDLFQIKRDGNFLEYYRNTTLLRRVTLPAVYNSNYRVDVSINSGTTPVIQASFDTKIRLRRVVSPVTHGGTGGSVQVLVQGGLPPYTYSWSSGENTSLIENKAAGTYSVTVQDSQGRSETKEFYLGYKSDWIEVSTNVSVNANNQLVKSGSNAWDAGAATSNLLSSGTNGWMEIPYSNTSAVYVVGLSRANIGFNYTTIQYGFYFNGNNILIYESGTSRGSFGKAVTGDIFKIAIENGSVKYYHNDYLLRTVAAVTNDGHYMVDASIYTTGAGLPPVITTFDSRIIPKATVTGVNNAGTGGGVTLVPMGGTLPYTYNWNTGETGNIINDKPAGDYSVTITDAEGRTTDKTFTLGYAVDWTDVSSKIRVVADNSLQLYQANTWQGAASNNLLMPNTNGGIEFIVNKSDAGYYRIGLSPANQNGLATNIAYGITINSTGVITINENNTQQANLGMVRPSDVFKIVREGAAINYYRNGDLVRTLAVSANSPLLTDVSVYSGRMPVIISSVASKPLLLGTIKPLDVNGQNGGVDLTVKGGTPPYAVTWSTGETGMVLSGKTIGTYTATVTDAAGYTAERSYSVGSAIEWTKLSSNISREAGYSLTKQGSSAWDAGASSKNRIAANEDGWIEFTVPYLGTTYVIGLSYSDPNYNYTSIGYGFYVNLAGGVSIFEAGVNKQSLGVLTKGDVFTIKRVGSQIQYYRNGQLLLSSATNPANNLYVDASVYYNGKIPGVFGSFKLQSLTSEQKIVNNLAFHYRYDAQKRMTAKKVPGGDWVYMVYDNRDRLVLTQDANQRVTNQWLFTKYDAFNRPIITGLYKHTGTQTTQAEMQIHVDLTINAADKYYEDWNGTAANHGYTNKAFPTGNTTVLTVNYYDNYDFKALFNEPSFNFESDHLDGQETTPFERVTGLQTGGKIRMISSNTWMRSVNYYDDKYRMVQTVGENYQGRISRNTNRYDFLGKVVETNRTENKAYPVIWIALLNAKLSADKLVGYAANTWGGGGASLQVLPAGQDGWVETVLENITESRMFGFSDTNPDANYTTIDFAAYLAGSKLHVYESGANKGFLGDLKIGDVVRVQRISGVVYYKVNGVVLFQSATASNTALRADVSLHNTSSITSVTTSFGIDKNSTNTLRWMYSNGASISGTTVTKTASNAWNNGGFAGTLNALNGPGWMQFTATETNTHRMVGLSAVTPLTNYNQLDYCFYLRGEGTYDIRDGGAVKTSLVPYSSGDVFRIESDGTTVRYYRNGAEVYQSAIPPTKTYHAQVAIYTKNGTVGSLTVSFPVPYRELKTDIYQRFDYDHAGRLVKAWHKLNTDPEVLLATHEYNELGQLVDKRLYNTSPVEIPDNERVFKQSIDHRYNIRGWLTSINNASLQPDNINNDANDFFGMELAYDQPVTSITGVTDLQFNGNISAITWSNNLGLGAIKQRAYKYKYDPMNRLKDALHFEKNSSWAAAISYDERILNYDLNGNILQLTRNGKAGSPMDILAYDYGTGETRSNKLLKVTDTGDDTKGFIEGSTTMNDYSYDNNGNMVGDLNKDIQSILYNYLNLPEKITKVNGEYIKYLYDASGLKWSQEVYDAKHVLQKKSDYLGSLFIQNDTLQFINHQEGRITVKRETESGSGTCVPCSELRTHVAKYSQLYGAAALLNYVQLTAYLNSSLSKKFDEDQYRAAVKDCQLTNFNVTFNATDSYVSFGDQPQYLMGTSDFTIEAWVNYPSSVSSGSYPIVTNQDYKGTGTAYTGFNLVITNGLIYLTVADGSNYSSIKTNALPSAGVWHHIVAQRIGNQVADFKLFVDGVEVPTTVHATGLTDGDIDIDGVEALKIGSRAGSSDNASFTGNIRQVRIYKRLLSAEEITRSYGGGCSGIPMDNSQLVLWAPLNEGTGNVANDLSSYNQSGSFVGTGLTWNPFVNTEACVPGSLGVLCAEENVYQYHMKDHLGNVRLTFTTKDEQTEDLATLETVNAEHERSKFLHYDEAVKVDFPLFDHTNQGSTFISTRLSGGENEKIGLAKSISVMPGDRINMEVYAKYFYLNEISNWSTALQNMILAMANGTAPTGTVVDGGAPGSIGNVIFPYGSIFNHSTEGGTPPKAYLSYIVFDRDFNPIISESGYIRVTEAAKEDGTDRDHEHLAAELLIKEPGYVYIYLSNENETPVEVYFDDFKVTHIKSPIVQTDDYYPFGLTFNSYKREHSLQNKYLFNGGSELQTDLNLGFYSTLFRTYDPAIGRFMQIDPLADFFSGINPYSFAYNNPILYGDPSGLGPIKDFFRRLFNGHVGDGASRAQKRSARKAGATGVPRPPRGKGKSGSSSNLPTNPTPPSSASSSTQPADEKLNIGLDIELPDVDEDLDISLDIELPSIDEPKPRRKKPPTPEPQPPKPPASDPLPFDVGSGGLRINAYQFEHLKDDIYHTPKNDKLIRDLVTQLKSSSGVTLEISGNVYAEPDGWLYRNTISNYKEELRDGRAKTLYDALRDLGIPASQLKITPGSIAPNSANKSATFILRKQ